MSFCFLCVVFNTNLMKHRQWRCKDVRRRRCSFWQFVFFSKLTLSSDGLQGSSSQILNIWFWVAVLQRIILSKYVTMNNDGPACEYQKLSEAPRKYWDLDGKNLKLSGPWPCSSREKQLGERLDGGKNRHESILYAPKSLCKTSSISTHQKNTHTLN